MRKERTLLILGVLIMIAPYLGFPSLFRSLLITCFGFLVLVIGYSFYKNTKKKIALEENNMQSFVESKNIDQ